MMLGRIIFCDGYDLTKSSWDNALRLFVFIGAHHGMCFSTACLSVCENGAIISIKNVID